VPFTTKEFPGRVFASLDELEATRITQKKLAKWLRKSPVVSVEALPEKGLQNCAKT
jgi:hypothetical protein